MPEKTILLTTTGQQKLVQELEHLRTVRRKEVAQRLHDATDDGDLEENVAYESAKEEQAFIEGRIRELERILAQAHLVQSTEPSGKVHIGSTVRIQGDDGFIETFTVVGAAESNPRMGLISYDSPLGHALLERIAGEEIKVRAPAGELRYRILQIN